MGARDAFGREIGEDSLASMGWKPSGAEPSGVTAGDPLTAFDAGEAASPFVRPEPAAKPSAPTAFSAGEAAAPFSRPKPRAAEPVQPAPAGPPRPPAPTFTPRRGGPSVARLGILIAILGVLAIGVSKAVEVGGDAVDGIRDRIESLEPDTPAATPGASGSLLRAAALRDALAKLPAGRVVLIRISAGAIDAGVVRAGKLHTVHMATKGPSADVTTPAGAGQRGFKLVPAAPLRVARTAARRAGLPVDDVDYIVGNELGWTLFFKDGGPRYRATLSGRKVTRF
jgi:hypothetical protein